MKTQAQLENDIRKLTYSFLEVTNHPCLSANWYNAVKTARDEQSQLFEDLAELYRLAKKLRGEPTDAT